MEEKAKKKFYQKWWFWVIVAVVLLGAFGNCVGNNEDTKTSASGTKYLETTEAITTLVPTNEPSATPSVSILIDTLEDLPVINFTLEEWVDNLNIWQSEIDESLVRYNDVEVSNGLFTLYLNNYVYYIGQLNQDGIIVSVMVGGVGDGTTDSGLAIINGIGGLVTSVHPEYTSDQRGNVLKALGILEDDMLTESSATIDGTTYSFMYSEALGVMMYASPND